MDNISVGRRSAMSEERKLLKRNASENLNNAKIKQQ